jgi:phosphatidate phosphatase APP1
VTHKPPQQPEAQRWRRALTRVSHSAERRYDRLKGRLEMRFGNDRAVIVQPYRWYGTADKLHVRGRVLRYNKLRGAIADDSWLNDLLNSYRRFNSDEVAYAQVEARFGEVVVSLMADDEGYFSGALEGVVLAENNIWHPVHITVIDPIVNAEPATAIAQVLVPPPTARFGIISDVDDTILQTHATTILKFMQVTFLQNASKRLPFAGVAAFYRALQSGTNRENNPIFYVSSSPTNLYDLLTDFMGLQEIPPGPVCLRDIGIDENKFLMSGHHDHKWKHITGIMDTYPDLPFVLIGDSGQKDPEIYAAVAQHYPGRVLAVYIRDVTQKGRDIEVVEIAGELSVPMLLVPTTGAAARHAASLGLITNTAANTVIRDTV